MYLLHRLSLPVVVFVIMDESEIEDGYALVSQLNELRDEFLKAKYDFEKRVKDMETSHILELKKRDIKIEKLQTRNCSLEQRVAVIECELKELEVRIDDNEQYSRRQSLKLDGIPKKYNENSGDVLQTVYDEIDRLELEIDKWDVDRCHRNGPVHINDNHERQQTTLVKFTSWYARNKFYQARKLSSYYVKPDLTKRRENVFSYARDQLRNRNYVSNHIKYVFVDPNCNLMACTRTGRFMKFNTEGEFDDIVLFMNNTSVERENVYAMIESDLQSPFPGE